MTAIAIKIVINTAGEIESFLEIDILSKLILFTPLTRKTFISFTFVVVF
ncbi:protein of unknown function [Vibrio tapetis subsp. tapetis]|uniref:Uncharacterized protein n=1 Tax=Vibrio tapetis subsp. tapetis TaxID=1671868 RepID=A0A2N8ZHV4_9VIBR|nr:protein of unknown function [Vibrio tapetis subsp. tapetis]